MSVPAIRFREIAIVLACLLSLPCLAQSTPAQGKHADAKAGDAKGPAPRTSQASLDRGRYIVENIAICSQCHTPRDAQGNLERSKWLQGASLWLQPSRPQPNWPLQAPRIGGNPPGTDDEMVRLLTTGLWKDGNYLRPPMPQFRMSKEDAEAVVAYLKSITARP